MRKSNHFFVAKKNPQSLADECLLHTVEAIEKLKKYILKKISCPATFHEMSYFYINVETIEK